MQRLRNRFVSAAGTLLLAGALAPAYAQHAGDMQLASTADGGGALTIEFDFATVIPVTFLTEVAGTSVYTATEPGLQPLATDEPLENLFVLDAGTQVSVEITALEPGKTAMNLNGTLLDTVGESVVLGTQGAAPPNDLHHHPELQLLLTLPPGEYGTGTLSFKLTTTSPSYTASASYTLTLSNGHLAPIEYGTAEYDKSSVACQQTIGKEVKGFLGATYQTLAKCLDKFQVVEALEAAGQDATSAESAVASTCGQKMLDKLAAIEAKANAKIAAKCGAVAANDLGPESIAAHLGFIGCRIEEMISASYPGAQALLGELTVGGNPLSDYFPCLIPAAAHDHP